MKLLAGIILFLILSVCLKSQNNCTELSFAIKLYEANNLKEAIKNFKIVKKNSVSGDNCYVQSCYWLGKCYFELSSNHPDISQYLGKAINLNHLDALRFYALEIPYYNTFISDDIKINDYLKLYDNGEIYFLIGNIEAKRSSYNHSELFDYLRKAVDQGYNSEALYSDNFLRNVNPERYGLIIGDPGENLEFVISQFELYLKIYVEKHINSWQKKGKFEKTALYLKRVNEESRQYEIERLSQHFIDSIGSGIIDFKNANNDYDADNEVFKITFNNINSIYLPVPIGEAKDFDSHFKSIKYADPKFTYYDGNFEILHLEVLDPILNKKYIFDSKELIAYNSNSLALNFDEIDIELANNKTTNVVESSSVINVGKSDVDEDIPINHKKDQYKYALIIGNEDYTQYQSGINTESNVDFARSDAISFSNYCEKVLGFPKENIVLLTDAISSQMNREIEKLMKLAQYSNGKAEIVFYYAGHGFPDESTKESYLMPVDISGSEVASGIKLSNLYQKLSKYPTKKTTVFLDACFSGSGRNKGLMAVRGVKIVPKEDTFSGNLVVFSASTGDQSSLPYVQKQHGIFTYFLLKKLKESKGNVSYSDLSEYIKNQVQLNSIKVNNKDQNPQTLLSPDVINIWEDWKFVE